MFKKISMFKLMSEAGLLKLNEKISAEPEFKYDSNADIEALYKLFKNARARIEIIKNDSANKNDLEIVEVSDKNCSGVPFYDEMNKTAGFFIESFQRDLKIRFKCKSEGNLAIILRSKNLNVFSFETFNPHVDYTDFLINQNKIKTPTIQNGNYIKTLHAHADEIYDLNIDWEIHW